MNGVERPFWLPAVVAMGAVVPHHRKSVKISTKLMLVSRLGHPFPGQRQRLIWQTW